MTTIKDKITYYDGSVATGKIVVTWPPFDYGGSSVAAGQQEYPIAPDGSVVIECYPCVGAQPLGTYYTATYELDKGATYDEYWLVPATTVTTIGAIRVSVPETPSVMINAQQLTNSGAQSGMFLGWSGSGWVPMYPSSFNCAVRSFFTRTGDVMPLAGDYTVDQVTNAVSDARRVIAGTGLTGGGPLTADVTLSLTAGVFVPPTTQVIAGYGLTGGGALSGNVTLAVVSGMFALQTTRVVAGSGLTGGGPLSSNVTLSLAAGAAVPPTTRVIAGYGLTGGGPLSGNVTLAVVDNTSIQKVQLALSGSLKSTRHQLNFVAGTGVNLNLVDDAAGDEGTLTITAVSAALPGPSIFSVNGVQIGTQAELNLIASSGATLVGVNNTGAGRVDVTVSAAGGSGSQTPWVSNIDGGGFTLTNAGALMVNSTVYVGPLTGTFLLLIPNAMEWTNVGNPRWFFGTQGTESGSDSGSDLGLFRYSDDGAYLDYSMLASRASGQIQFSCGASTFSINSTAPSGNVLFVQGGITCRTQIFVDSPGAAVGSSYIYLLQGGNLRWLFGKTAAPESGSNLGTDFILYSYNDDGTQLRQNITINRANGSMAFNCGTGGMSVTSPTTIFTGNVGINSPGNFSVLNGAISCNYIAFNNYTGGADPAFTSIINPFGNYLYINALGVNTAALWLTGQGAVVFRTDSGPTEKMRLDINGRLGIGVTAPAFRLDVAGDCNLSAGSVYRINGVAITTGAGAQTPWTSNQDAATFNLNNVGRIGIGTTTNAAAALHISKATTGGYWLRFQETVTPLADYGFGIENPTGALLIDDIAAGARRITLTQTGDVGIGNSGTPPYVAPGYTVLVVGPTASSSTYCGYIVAAGNAVSGGMGGLAFANYAIAGTEKRIAMIQGLTDGTLDSGALLFYTFLSSAANERMRLVAGGRLGLGTQSPQAMLHVSRAQTGVTAVLIDNGGSGVGTAQAVQFGYSAGTILGGIYHQQASAGWQLRFKAWNNAAETERMTIDGATGNVGISTTLPDAILQVRPTPSDSGSHTMRGAVFFKSATNNGGSSPAAPEPALILGREGIGGQAFANFVEFQIRRFDNTATNSRTQMDMAMTDGQPDNNPGTVASYRSDGRVWFWTGPVCVGSAYAAQAGDLGVARASNAGTGAVYFGNGGHNITWDGGNFQFSYSINTAQNVTCARHGIGIGNPAVQLHLYGGGQAPSAYYWPAQAAGGTMILQDSGGGAGNGGAIEFSSAYGTHAAIRGYVTNGSGPMGDLVFYSRPSAADTALYEKLRLFPNGDFNINGRLMISGALVGTISSAQNVTGSRAVNINYTNPRGKPMFVNATCMIDALQYMHLEVDGGTIVSAATNTNQNNISGTWTVSGWVMTGQSYKVFVSGGSLNTWFEWW